MATNEASSSIESLQLWARLAGVLFLWLIVSGVGGSMLVSHAAGSGDIHQVAQNVAASEILYRCGLVLEVLETLCALLLGFCLFCLLHSAGPALAHLALLWRMAEAIIGSVGMIFGFTRLRIYLALAAAPAATGSSFLQAQALVDFTRYAGNTAYLIGATCFGIGSLLYFFLFRRTNFLPKSLSLIGVLASVAVVFVCVGSMLFPAEASRLQYGWVPMAIAEVGAALWLLLFGVRGPKVGRPN